jgi:hypothetical protein
LEYTGAELHRVAASNLRLPVRPNDGILHISQQGTRQWLDPSIPIGVQGVAHNDTILILPYGPPSTASPPVSESISTLTTLSLSHSSFPSSDPEIGPPPRARKQRIPVAFSRRVVVPINVLSRPIPDEIPITDLIVRQSDFTFHSSIANRIFRSVDRRTGTDVAVKPLPDVLGDDDIREQFESNLQRIASIRHPTLLSLIGFVPVNNDAGESPNLCHVDHFQRFLNQKD